MDPLLPGLPPDPDKALLDQLEAIIDKRAGGRATLVEKLPSIVRASLEFVLDPIRTGRTSLSELDKVEKTFIGLKVEHFFRDFLDLPKGLRDLNLEGIDVDVKNSVAASWEIPRETYSNNEPVILIASTHSKGTCSLGLLVARLEYLNKPNQDQKRTISREGHKHIRWLLRDAPLPPNPWEGIDMALFRELRNLKGGNKRVVRFFQAHLGRPIEREILLALLHPQKDPMKRLRGNGGARDPLAKQGIVLLSGTYDRERATSLGFPDLGAEQWVAIATNQSDT